MLKVFLEGVIWNIILFENYTENKLVISKYIYFNGHEEIKTGVRRMKYVERKIKTLIIMVILYETNRW